MHMSHQKYTPLLHGYKENAAYDQLKDAVFDNEQFRIWANDEKYQKLLQKLWRMTGYHKLEPSISYEQRLKQMQTIAQQMSIERAHQMEVREVVLLVIVYYSPQNDLREQNMCLNVPLTVAPIYRVKYCD